MHLRITRLIDAPVERALEVATDLRQWTQMFDSLAELRPLTSGGLTVGSQLFAVRTIGPLKMQQVLEVASITDSGMVIRTEGPGPARIVVSIGVVDERDAARVTIDLSGRVAQPLSLLTPLLGRRLRRDWEGFLARVADALEPSAVAASGAATLGREAS